MRYLAKTCMAYLTLAVCVSFVPTIVYGQDVITHRWPKFEDYRVEVMDSLKKALLNIPEESEATKKTLESYYRTPINYAGKYVFISISFGPGGGGERGFVVNAQTGKMIFLPDVYCYVETLCKKGYGYDFRQDSSLIILTGVLVADGKNLNKDVCRYYYNIEGDGIHLIDTEFLEDRK